MSKYTAEQARSSLQKMHGHPLTVAERAELFSMASNYADLLRERESAKARVPDVVADVMAELDKAMTKFPTWPTDPLHAVGVFNEEAGELAKAVLQQVYEPHKNEPDDVRKEALQAAAMAIRFLASLDRYDWARGAQHEQEVLK